MSRATIAKGKAAEREDVLAWLALAAVTALAVRHYLWADSGGFTEEAIPFRQALTLWGWGDRPPTAHPRFFSYPSVSIYLHWLAQAAGVVLGVLSGRFVNPADAGVEFVLDAGYLSACGRIMLGGCSFACSVLVYQWWRPRNRLIGLLVGGALATSPLMLRTILRMPPEVIMAPLLLLLISTSARHRSGAPVQVGVVAGLLLGVKLSALPCVAVALIAAVRSDDDRRVRWGQLLLGSVIVAVAFIATSPFAVLDFGAFWRDTVFELGHLRSGHLLGSPTTTISAHASQLWQAFGLATPVTLLLLPFSWNALTSRARLLAAIALSLLVPALLARSGGPERYVLPALPVLWLLLTEVIRESTRSAHGPVRFLAFAAAVLAIGQGTMLAVATFHARPIAPTSLAGRRVAQMASRSDIIVRELGAIALPTNADAIALQRSRCYQSASERWQTKAREAEWRSIVTLPFAAAGEISYSVGMGVRSQTIPVFSPSWRMMPAVYAVLEDARPQILARSDVVTQRIGSVFPQLSPGPLAAQLGVTRSWEYSGATSGIREDARVTVLAMAEPPVDHAGLSPTWWLAHAEPADSSGEQARVARLGVFRSHFEPLLIALAESAVRAGRPATAVRAARLILTNDADHLLALRLALLAVGACTSNVPDRVGSAILSRKAPESETEWIRRVILDWGVSEAQFDFELERYEALRKRKRK